MTRSCCSVATDLAAWGVRGQDGTLTPASWAIADGVVTAGRGTLTTRESFGDVQLHVEFAMPSPPTGTSQSRGNSGLIFMGLYELQLLDSYNSRTYADGMAASIYAEWPPMVNIAAPPGEWQTLEVVFESPALLRHRCIGARLPDGVLEWCGGSQPPAGCRPHVAADRSSILAARTGTPPFHSGTRAGQVPEHLGAASEGV